MKITLVLTFLLAALQSFSQTTITTLPATIVKSHGVRPVRIDGNTDYFHFEGFYTIRPGCIKINTGLIDRTKCDQFSLEFAGNYEGNPNIPLYFIRRTDGLYLSFQLGGAAFVNKILGEQSRFQKWLISKVDTPTYPQADNAYNLLLPLAPFRYGYVLKVFNSYTQLGFSDGPKILAFESEFYIGHAPKKSHFPLQTSIINSSPIKTK